MNNMLSDELVIFFKGTSLVNFVTNSWQPTQSDAPLKQELLMNIKH
jgi:hypothetical protein